MNTVSVTVKLDQRTKQKAQSVAEELGMSLSSMIRSLVEQKVVNKPISKKKAERSENPNAYMQRMLKESEEDVKAGRVLSFNNGEEALKYLNRIIRDKQRGHES